MNQKDICFLSVFIIAIITYIVIENKKINAVDRLARYTITEKAIVYEDESKKMGELYDSRYRATMMQGLKERYPSSPPKQDSNSAYEIINRQFQ
jgi:hypothetical protein